MEHIQNQLEINKNLDAIELRKIASFKNNIDAIKKCDPLIKQIYDIIIFFSKKGKYEVEILYTNLNEAKSNKRVLIMDQLPYFSDNMEKYVINYFKEKNIYIKFYSLGISTVGATYMTQAIYCNWKERYVFSDWRCILF